MVERTVVERTVVERTVVETTSGGKHTSLLEDSENKVCKLHLVLRDRQNDLLRRQFGRQLKMKSPCHPTSPNNSGVTFDRILMIPIKHYVHVLFQI